MRRFMNLLREYRLEQINTNNEFTPQQKQQLSERADAAFRLMDARLSGARLTPGGNLEGPETQLREVMTTDDFRYAIGEYVNRRLLDGYRQVQFNFERLVYNDTLPNYMVATRYQRRGTSEDLEYVPEKGQARAGSFPDANKKQWAVHDWKKQFDLSMHMLKNDDLGYFNDFVQDIGLSARRTLERFVSRLYTNATTIARLTGLGALYATTGRLTSTRVSAARHAMAQRTDESGNPIVARLDYIVHPIALRDTVAQILRSELVPELATNGINVVAGAFTPIEDPHMAATAPNLPWYGMSDPNNGTGIRPFVLARLNGWPGPRVFRVKTDMEEIGSLYGAGVDAPPELGDFATSNIILEVWDVWGTYVDPTEGNLLDYRGVFYSSGTVA